MRVSVDQFLFTNCTGINVQSECARRAVHSEEMIVLDILCKTIWMLSRYVMCRKLMMYNWSGYVALQNPDSHR